jgi:CBS domain containing-hemolysin-like protein
MRLPGAGRVPLAPAMDPAVADLLLTFGLMVACLLAEGFFSGSEMAVVSADRMKLRHDAAKGSSGAKLALEMLSKPEWLLSTTLVGTNISVVANTTMATALMLQMFGEYGSWLAVALVAPLIWVFGEIVPKSVFQQRADSITPRVIFLLRFFSWLFYPILLVFSLLTRLMARMVGDRTGNQNPFTLREEIFALMQMSADGGDIDHNEKAMIRRLFDFEETTVAAIMMPLIDVVGIEQGASCGEAMRLARTRAHKRMPVYAKRVDRIVGMLDALELLGVDPQEPITSYIRPVDYVPGSKSIQTLLMDMQRERHLLSVVVDEFGGAEGIVTVEDIIEEIVEDLSDEFDVRENPTGWLRKLGERDYLVSARIEPERLAEALGVKLPEGKYATLAGFLLERVRDVPVVGTRVRYNRVTFVIQRGSERAIEEVRVKW